MKFVILSTFLVTVAISMIMPNSGHTQPPRVDICHFQEENDSWKLLSLPQQAATIHLKRHDDALPSGATSQTAVVLDESCKPIEIICPCDYRTVPMTLEQWGPIVIWNQIYGHSPGIGDDCHLHTFFTPGEPWTHIRIDSIANPPGGIIPVFEECDKGAVCYCEKSVPGGSFVLWDLSTSEAFACAAAINSYARELANIAGISVVLENDAPCRTAP